MKTVAREMDCGNCYEKTKLRPSDDIESMIKKIVVLYTMTPTVQTLEGSVVEPELFLSAPTPGPTRSDILM